MRRQISHILENPQLESKDSRRKTVFKALLESDLPPQELSPLRLQHEATTIIGAGVETTRWALSVGCFHILNTPAIFQRLRKELEEAIPDPDEMPSLEKLEQLPYLAACIEECERSSLSPFLCNSNNVPRRSACRMSYGTSQRGHRISDHMYIAYGAYVIPPMTVISMDNVAQSELHLLVPYS